MTNRKLLLYADDDPDDHDMLESAFSGFPEFELLHFSDGQQVLDTLHKLDAIPIWAFILDNNMPLKTGVDTLREIRKLPAYQDTAAFVYTTARVPAIAEEVAVLGGRLFVKPSTYADIQATAATIAGICSNGD